MVISSSLKFTTLFLCSAVFISACSAAPTKRYYDDGWTVSENICTSDPGQPDLNDMRSIIKQKETYQTAFEREISMFHRERQILIVTQKFSRAGSDGEITLFENSEANDSVATKKINHTRELNNEIEASLESFFEQDPEIDWKEAESFCLYRGQ